MDKQQSRYLNFSFLLRKLRKPRVTRIHMNLFASMILQCLVRLVIYADQWIVRQQQHSKPISRPNDENITVSSQDEVWGIDNTVSNLIKFLDSWLLDAD